jgi:hypothetical protein
MFVIWQIQILYLITEFLKSPVSLPYSVYFGILLTVENSVDIKIHHQ